MIGYRERQHSPEHDDIIAARSHMPPTSPASQASNGWELTRLSTISPSNSMWEPVLEGWRTGNTTCLERTYTDADRVRTAQGLNVDPDDDSVTAWLDQFAGDWHIYNVPFTYGTIGCHCRESSPRHIQVLEALAEALELGYLRYHDLQEAESRALQAELDLGVERVRATAMAMVTPS